MGQLLLEAMIEDKALVSRVRAMEGRGVLVDPVYLCA